MIENKKGQIVERRIDQSQPRQGGQEHRIDLMRILRDESASGQQGRPESREDPSRPEGTSDRQGRSESQDSTQPERSHSAPPDRIHQKAQLIKNIQRQSRDVQN